MTKGIDLYPVNFFEFAQAAYQIRDLSYGDNNVLVQIEWESLFDP